VIHRYGLFCHVLGNKEDCRADALAVRGEPRADVAIYDMLDENEEKA
jgi:hypothetical protein